MITMMPGEYISFLMKERNMTLEDTAKKLNISEDTLKGFLDGTYKIGVPFAFKLEQVFYRSAASWLTMQADYYRHRDNKK